MRLMPLLCLTVLLALSTAEGARAESFLDFLGAGSNRKPISEELFAGDPLSKEKVALLSLDGTIMKERLAMTGALDVVETLRQQLAFAAKDADLKGILLELDSPGGGITASDILYKALVDVRAKGKKVVVLMGDLAASGGYFVSVGADLIYAHPTTLTGSIGVIVQSVNVEGLYEKLGLKDVTLKSARTPFKDMLSSTRSMTDEEKKIMQGILEQMYEHFVDVVAKARKLAPEKVRALADGRIYSAKEAKDAGLIDEIGFREDALPALYKLCGLKKEPKLVKYRKAFNLQDFLSPASSSSVPAGQLLERLLTADSAPRFLYLWAP